MSENHVKHSTVYREALSQIMWKYPRNLLAHDRPPSGLKNGCTQIRWKGHDCYRARLILLEISRFPTFSDSTASKHHLAVGSSSHLLVPAYQTSYLWPSPKLLRALLETTNCSDIWPWSLKEIHVLARLLTNSKISSKNYRGSSELQQARLRWPSQDVNSWFRQCAQWGRWLSFREQLLMRGLVLPRRLFLNVSC